MAIAHKNMVDRKEIKKLEQIRLYQRELENYQLLRKLPKPRTTKIEVVIYCVVLLLLIISTTISIIILETTIFIKAIIIFVGIMVVCLYLRFLGVEIVKCYQHYSSEETRRRCLCIPSCSEYSIMCFKKFILIKALLKIRKRLKYTCKGDEYKIDFP